MITTLGKKGSILIAPSASQTDKADQDTAQEAVLDSLLQSMLNHVTSNHATDGKGGGDGDGSRPLGCTTRDGTHIK